MKELTGEEVKTYQVDILNTADAWCKANGVHYFMAGGTLLGAVRHQGYIPWDDDIDIWMLRSDYDFFIEHFNKNRQDAIRVLHSKIDPLYPYEFAKVHNRATRLVEEAGTDYKIGVNIDLFVLDNLPGGTVSGEKLLRKIRPYRVLLSWQFALVRDKKRNFIKQSMVRLYHSIVDLIPLAWITGNMNQKAGTYSSVQNSEWVGSVCQRWFCVKNIMRKDWFAETVELPFEGHMYSAPKGYDNVLRACFGDYMQLPPEEERVTHHVYKAYEL